MPRLFVHLAALSAILSPLFCAAQLPQRRNPAPPPKTIKIQNLTLKSDTPLPKTESEVKAEIETAPAIEGRPGWLQDLAARVLDIFQHWGYFKASVEHPHAETLSGSGQQELVNITLEVDPGRQYRTGNIKFVKSTQFGEEQLRDFFSLGQGDVLDTHKIGEGLQRLRSAYGERGFINFAAVPNTTIDEAQATISLIFDLDEGPQFLVGTFEILGLDPALAHRLIEGSGMQPGSIFNPKLVDAFFERNRALLPADAKPEDDTARTVDEQRRIVNLRMDFRRCPTATQ